MIVSLLLVLLIAVGVYVASHRLNGTQIAVITIIGVLGLSMVIFPGIASYFATLLGVGRGTDLVLYLAIVGGLFATAHLYFRNKLLEERLTVLTRAIALRQSGSRRGETETSGVAE